MTDLPQLADFPHQTFDKLRYGDTDRQGHVNNAVFATLYETGRVAVFHDREAPLAPPGFSFVIARITINYVAEIFWPGRVEIGTGVKSLGTSSISFAQALFQNGKCVSTAESIVVQVAAATRRGAPLAEPVRLALETLLLR